MSRSTPQLAIGGDLVGKLDPRDVKAAQRDYAWTCANEDGGKRTASIKRIYMNLRECARVQKK